MTDVAAGVLRPLGQKDRLDAAFEIFVVEFRRRLRHGDGGNGKRRDNRYACESTTRHSTLRPRCWRSSSDGTSNATADKPDLGSDNTKPQGGSGRPRPP